MHTVQPPILRDGDPVWVFAYGSLIWRPDFPFQARVRSYVDGFARRFWQRSIDHRGVPDKPGRVVTLIPEQQARCWGVSYRIEPSEQSRVLAQLFERERGGYHLQQVVCTAKDRAHSGKFEAVAFVAKPEHPLFAGVSTLEEVAEVVREAAGPSGHNVEYVLRLAEALADLEVADDEVFELANRLVDPSGDLSHDS